MQGRKRPKRARSDLEDFTPLRFFWVLGLRNCKNLSNPTPPGATLAAMNPFASFAFLIATAQSLVAAVMTRDNLHLRPTLARQAVAARLRSGIIVLRAFLRRLIILMALELEWTLVDKRGEMKRPHGRTSKSSITMNIRGLEAPRASPWLSDYPIQFRTKVKTGYNGPVDITMAKFYAQLDYLAKVAASFDLIAADILTKSKNRPPPLPPPRTYWPTITAL
jgi:hypothetical protein